MPIKIPESILRSLDILVVDDVVSARRFSSMTLQEVGFKKIKEASGVEDSLRLMRLGFTGMVLCDLHLKDGKAIDLIKKARDNFPTRPFMFLVITSDLDKDSAASLSEMGLSTCILKPYSAETLVEKMAMLMVQKQKELASKNNSDIA